MDNQDSRRSSGVPPNRPSGVIDFGPSPPWGIPPSIFEESAERFKPLPSRSSEGQQNAAIEHGLPQRYMQSGTGPISQQHRHSVHQGSDRKFETSQFQDQQERKATNQGHHSRPRDSVYMINASHSSWSGHLPSETGLGHLHTTQVRSSHPPIHLERQPESFAESQSDKSQSSDLVFTKALQNQQAWRTDLHLTNIVRYIKAQLQAGALITIEYMSNAVDHGLLCDLPYCTAPQHRIQANSYYITLDFPHAEESILQYCLSCFEGLWNGDDIMSTLPSVHVREKQPSSDNDVSVMALDGAMDDKSICWTPINRCAGTPVTLDGDCYHSSASPPSDGLSRPGTELSSHIECSPSAQAKAERCTPDANAAAVPMTIAELHDYLSSLDCKALPPRAKTSSEGTNQKPHRNASIVSGTKASADNVSTEVRRAQTRLERMYDERRCLVATLKPGQKKILQCDRSDRSGVQYMVSMDELGVISTDLLEKPTSRTRARAVRERASAKAPSANSPAPIKRRVRSPNAAALAQQSAALMCKCSRPDDGSLSIECDNQRCLIGWYHASCLTECVNEEWISGEGTWLCPLCKSTTQPGNGSMPSPREDDAELLLSPPYATPSDPYLLQYRRESIQALHGSPQEKATEFPASLPQLDGSDESSPLSSPLSSIPDLQTPPGGTYIDPVSEQGDVPDRSEDMGVAGPMGEEIQEPPRGSQRSSPSDSGFRTPGTYFSPHSLRLLSDEELFGFGPKTPSHLANVPTPRGILSSTPSDGQMSSERSTTSSSAHQQTYTNATRMQHLAAFVRPGQSLDQTQRAAVDLWRLASHSQLQHELRVQWNAQLQKHFERRYNRTASQSHSPRSDCGDAQYDGGEECESGIPSPPATRWNMLSSEECTALFERETEVGRLVGMDEEQCKGKDLSEVLNAAAGRDGDEED